MWCFLVMGALAARGAVAAEWARYAIVSPTTTLSGGHLCYTDGLGIACDGGAPLASGLGLGDRITSGTTSVVAAQDGPVSVTIAGSNVANFGAGGLGITAINASGLVTAAGVSTTGPISGTAGYFSGNVSAQGQYGALGSNYYFNPIAGNLNTGNLYLGILYSSDGTARANFTNNNFNLINSKVGIATTLPAATLQVSGSFIVSTTGQNTTPSLYVGTNGKVGVGVSNPATALNVLGGVYIQNRPGQDGNDVQGLLSADGTRRFAWYVASNYAYFQAENGASLNFGVIGDLTRNIAFWSNNETNVAMMVQNSTGRVGIGTTAPSQAMEVSGTISGTIVATGGIKGVTSTAIACATSADLGNVRWSNGRAEACSAYP